jgi:hypothetical protein
MATANSSINISELDFDTIKNSLKSYLSDKPQFKDYNFEGSTISTVLDILAYNTHYNSFYLNMVSNEMFLDTALKRSSVVSHAKLMNYTPRSAICSKATANIVFNGVQNASSFTIPKYTKFYSESVEGVNYPFVTQDSVTATVSNNTATFTNVVLVQGQPLSYTFTVDTTTNPKTIFKIPDSSVDLSTLRVRVYQNAQETAFDVYNGAESYLTLDPTTKVYFIQESMDGYYELYFGDGILGKSLITSNVVIVEYISTKASAVNGVKKFTLVDNLSNYSNCVITSTIAATGGIERETIDSIKYQAPKAFSAQGRAVTKEDYITAIQQNKFGYSFDAVNVWGGEENDSPVYGQVFVCMKPTGGYVLTDTQKTRLVTEVIKPISVMTVQPTIVDPDYTYVKLDIDVLYNPKLTTLTAQQIQTAVKTLVQSFGDSTLNTFNSTFMVSELNSIIKNADPSIITNEVSVKLQKKFYPILSVPTSYKFYYRTPLQKGLFSDGVSSYPGLQFRDKINLSTLIDGISIEEVPSETVGVESIAILNPGFGYQSAPTVTITGDGTGATAVAVLSSTGSIKSIDVLTKGSGYTSAVVTITPAANDTTGKLAVGVTQLEGRYGTLRLYYNNPVNGKTIYSTSVGTIDYTSGIVSLDSFNPVSVDDPLGQLTIIVKPESTIFSSTYNSIITLDPFDQNAITVNVIAKG